MVGILLGTQLRRLRKARGMSVEVASHAIGPRTSRSAVWSAVWSGSRRARWPIC